MADFYQQAKALFDYSQGLRRDLHRHPELGFHEVRTAGVVARELGQLGLEMTTGVAETGVVALLEGKHPGPTVLLRFDMDALPVQEETGNEFASQTAGVMHACGHDGHVAVGLTAARMLNDRREQLHGQVKFVFQPAEEGQGGAERMIAAGVLDHPRPERVLALHIWNELPVGTIAIVPGPLMAGGEKFGIKLIGKGGHGALPHLAVDPIAAAAQLITALQSVVARNISPLESAVISVTQVRAGEAFNVIPPTAELAGTIRTFRPEIRTLVLSRFRQVVESIAEAMGCGVKIDLVKLTPPVINDAALAEGLAQRIGQSMPEAELVTNFQTMVSEDIAYMMEQIPGCYMLVGGANPANKLDYPHHHPKFDFDEQALILASALMAAAASELLS
jgi:amidohydrolase